MTVVRPLLLAHPLGHTAPMVEITSRETFEAWLEGKPPEAAAALALRIALRVVPLMEQEFVNSRRPAERIADGLTAPVLRVHAAARFVRFAPNRATSVARVINSRASAYHAAVVAVTFAGVHAARTAVRIADAAYAAVETADAAADAAADADDADALWSNLTADVRFLEAKGTVEALTVQPLWLEGEPAWVTGAWASLTRRLLELKDQKWPLWIDWYNGLRIGRAPWSLPRDKAEALMGEAVLWDRAEWQAGPEHINPKIEALIRAAGGVIEAGRETAPAQDATATLFRAGRRGPVRLAPRQQGDGLTDTPEQREWHAELRRKTKILQAFGGNELGTALGGSVDRFSRALGRSLSAGRWVSLWSEGNSLRCKLSAHDKAPKNEPDPARLKHDVAESLRDLVETYNQLVVGDEKLSARDQQRPGPQDRKTLETQANAGDLIVRIALGREGVADPEVKATLKAGQEAAKTATPDIHGDQALDQTVRQQRNFVIAWVRAAGAWVKGETKHAGRKIADSAYSEAGKTIAGAAKDNAGPLVTAITENAAGVISYIQTAFTNASTIQFLTGIVRSIIGG